MSFEIKPFPEWSWSKSRAHLLEECPRKYYYHYYGGHNGWLKEAPKEAQLIYRLKQLTNLYLAFGNIMHIEIKNTIKGWQESNRLPEAPNIVEEVRNRLNQVCHHSTLKDKWWNSPTRFSMLHERYYGTCLPEYRVKYVKDNIHKCVNNFLNSKTVTELLENRLGDMIEIDEDLNYFFLDNQKIYVKLDLLCKNNTDWLVVDWKTGQEDKNDKDQMLIYALYIKEKYGVHFENIEIRTEYLSSGECNSERVNPQDLNNFIDKIRTSQHNMKTLLKSVELNQPLVVQAFTAIPSKKKCGWCNFCQICSEKLLEEWSE